MSGMLTNRPLDLLLKSTYSEIVADIVNNEGADKTAQLYRRFKRLQKTHFVKMGLVPQLAFYVNLHRAVIGPSATLTDQ